MKTVLALVQSYCREKGIAVPASLVGSTNSAELQLLELYNKVGRDLVRRKTWEILKRRKEFDAVATEDQGLITTIIGSDCDAIIPNTFYNDTQRLPIYGPVGDKEYQQIQALLPQGPFLEYRIQQGHLYITGSITAGDDLALIYKSNAWLETAAASGSFIAEVAADTNVSVFDDDLMLLGLDYQYRKTKEIPFNTQLAAFESAIVNAGGTDNVPPIIRMDRGTTPIVRPGIIVPAGNWNV